MDLTTPTSEQRRSRGVRRDDTAPNTLYRAYDVNGRLLYVGISRSWLRRWEHHKTESPWFDDVRRIDLEPHPDRASALDAERKAIHREMPLHNTEHNHPNLRSGPRSNRPLSERVETTRRRLEAWRPIYGPQGCCRATRCPVDHGDIPHGSDGPAWWDHTASLLTVVDGLVAGGADLDREITAEGRREFRYALAKVRRGTPDEG